MSSRQQPSSRSSCVRQASDDASGSRTVSLIRMPARFAAVTRFCVAMMDEVTSCTFTSRCCPTMPSGSRIPSCASTINSCGKTCRISRSSGRLTLRAASTARCVNLPEDREILHVLPHEFIVDAHDGIRDPLGMVGQHLEVNVQLVTSSIIATQNLVTAANRAGILISDTVLEPLASSDACLTQDERELGCCLLDIGGGTTEIIVYGGGAIRHTSAVGIGGDHFTNDLAVGLRTPIPEAERIKRHHGCASSALLRDDASIEIASVGDRPPRSIFARSLCEIIEPRAQELLALIRDDLQRAVLMKQIPAGFIFAGGGARLNGLDEMTEQLFHLPVRIAEPKGILDLPEQVAQPEYATAVGLVLYGAKARRNSPARSGGIVGKLKAMFAGA